MIQHYCESQLQFICTSQKKVYFYVNKFIQLICCYSTNMTSRKTLIKETIQHVLLYALKIGCKYNPYYTSYSKHSLITYFTFFIFILA